MDGDEAYILLLLSDSNLPTGMRAVTSASSIAEARLYRLVCSIFGSGIL